MTAADGLRRVPVLYLDLDGTVRHGFDELGRFVNGPEDVRVFDEAPALLAKYKAAGWRLVAVSNQGGIALGHVTLASCLAAMHETDRQTGSVFDRICFCRHHPSATDPEFAVCWCRKPRPGLIIDAALSLSMQYRGEIYPPHLGLLVGDRPEDEGAAANAGLPFMKAADWRAGLHAIGAAS